jgi:hypothetical protein
LLLSQLLAALAGAGPEAHARAAQRVRPPERALGCAVAAARTVVARPCAQLPRVCHGCKCVGSVRRNERARVRLPAQEALSRRRPRGCTRTRSGSWRGVRRSKCAGFSRVILLRRIRTRCRRDCSPARTRARLGGLHFAAPLCCACRAPALAMPLPHRRSFDVLRTRAWKLDAFPDAPVSAPF